MTGQAREEEEVVSTMASEQFGELFSLHLLEQSTWYHYSDVCLIQVSMFSLCFAVCCERGQFRILLLFGRSRIIVSHHRLTDELFPAAAIVCSPYAL